MKLILRDSKTPTFSTIAASCTGPFWSGVGARAMFPKRQLPGTVVHAQGFYEWIGWEWQLIQL